MERIVSAAIQYTNMKNNKTEVVTGNCHANCLSVLSAKEIYFRENEIEGFMTSENRFVDRREAVNVAKAAKQVRPGYDKYFLQSYDIVA